MKKVVRILLVLSFSTLTSALIAQETDLYHLNQQSLKFRDGIYIQPIILTLRNEEFLVDIIDNKVWEFDLEGLERVLKNDSELWSEFKTLKKRQMEYMKYIFLKRYSKKYPLDIPFE